MATEQSVPLKFTKNISRSKGDPFGGPHEKKERKPLQIKDFRFTVAERTRFELAVELPLRQFSKLLVSATHPPLRKLAEIYFSIASAKVALFFDPASKLDVFFEKISLRASLLILL